MGLILLFIFQSQLGSCSYTNGTWPMYGATLENTHLQGMRGAMSEAPVVKWSYDIGDDAESHGASVADVNGDGAMEVVIGGGFVNKVYCFNGAVKELKWSYPTGDDVWSAPALSDVDDDDTVEVVIGSKDKKVYCLNGVTGLVKWSYPTGDEVFASPAVANVDNDDTLEVIVGSLDDKVYCLNGVTGLVKWSRITGGSVLAAPAVADVDGDGNLEVIVGSFVDKVYCLNGETGEVKWSSGSSVYSSAPAIADVDGDDTLEVVFGSTDKNVYCLDGVTGEVEWTYPTGAQVYSAPALADVDDDGEMEVVIGNGRWDGDVPKVYCLDGKSGVVEWSYETVDSSCVHRGISVADLDMTDAFLEVLVPSWSTSTLTCLNGEDGLVFWTKDLSYDIHDITIADVDGDNCVELIVGTLNNDIFVLDDAGGESDCGPMSVEERGGKREERREIEFKTMGKGIYLFTPNAVEVDVRVYDLCGRLRQILYKGVLSKGGHTFVPNIKSSGIYFVVLRTQELKESLKITRF